MYAAQTLTSRQEQNAGEKRVLTSDEILMGHKEIIISHDGSEYRLRRTNQNKLILTK